MRPETVTQMPWTSSFVIDHANRRVFVNEGEDETNAIREQLELARSQHSFKVLEGWRDEEYAILDSMGRKISMERAGSALFGIVTIGVHMVAYVKTAGVLKVWVPRRSPTKQTYPDMLDNTVAGGVSKNEVADPFAALVREAAEEASLPESLVRKSTIACGAVSYFHLRDKRAGGEDGLLQPEVQYVYDLQLPEDIVPRPSDDEVAGFELLSVDEVERALERKEFKPNCALVTIDFLIRHDQIADKHKPYLAEIATRLHRKFQAEGYRFP